MPHVSSRKSKLKRKPAPSAAEMKAREAEKKAEQVYSARHKFESLIDEAYRLDQRVDKGLVSRPEEDEYGLLEPEELALVPSQELYFSSLHLEDLRDRLDLFIKQIWEALDARNDSGSAR